LNYSALRAEASVNGNWKAALRARFPGIQVIAGSQKSTAVRAFESLVLYLFRTEQTFFHFIPFLVILRSAFQEGKRILIDFALKLFPRQQKQAHLQ
jgi:hypothetical protein